MENTPLASHVLSGVLKMHSWDQNELAKQSGISRAVVSFHLTGSRPIRDDHLAAYITALDKYEQSQLVAAWLQDTLPAAALENVLDSTSNTLREDVRTWSPDLTPEQQHMLQFWAAKIAADPELAGIFRSITRKAGWEPAPIIQHPATSIQPPAPTSPKEAALRLAARLHDEEHPLPPATAPAAPRSARGSPAALSPAPER